MLVLSITLVLRCVDHIIPIVKCLVDIFLCVKDFVVYITCEMSLVYTVWYLHHQLSVLAFCPRLFMLFLSWVVD